VHVLACPGPLWFVTVSCIKAALLVCAWCLPHFHVRVAQLLHQDWDTVSSLLRVDCHAASQAGVYLSGSFPGTRCCCAPLLSLNCDPKCVFASVPTPKAPSPCPASPAPGVPAPTTSLPLMSLVPCTPCGAVNSGDLCEEALEYSVLQCDADAVR
jgi:hypothetical protein